MKYIKRVTSMKFLKFVRSMGNTWKGKADIVTDEFVIDIQDN